MPDETAPTDATPDPAPAGSRSPSSVLGALGCGCVALLVVPVVVLVVLLSGGLSGSTDFPRTAPEKMADRAFQRSQEAYDLMGFTRTVRPGVEKIGVSTENTLSSGYCYDGGLLGLEDKTVDGAYRMSHSWALDHVPANQAVSGHRRLHRQLKDDGWEVTSYREGGKSKSWDLYVQRDDGSERMSFIWYPDREYFTGGTSVPCAYDPEWESGDTGLPGDDQSPPALGPAQRKK
ncbi:hypothetical protein OOK13_16910 [Streptomyces sp. NBC_00378]|uniref:hypothetical protein n=1 Tax=unclassified Streptomyces TaxID=2593676 RepID=UPI00224CC4E5|nr:MULTISPECIES: hypothetical protein [unclassified Streptomyces]MCX5110195.1 hypothetical protein [Streptomyces sp. NBC_00378]